MLELEARYTEESHMDFSCRVAISISAALTINPPHYKVLRLRARTRYIDGRIMKVVCLLLGRNSFFTLEKRPP